MTRFLVFTTLVVGLVLGEPFGLTPNDFSGQQPNYQPCTHPLLAHCQNQFNVALNITTNADWTDPTVLQNDLKALYLQGRSGFLSSCSARQQFEICLGPQYQSCMSAVNLVTNGESQQNANAYVQLFSELHFDCNGGFVQAVQNYDCISLIWNGNYTWEFQQCGQTFQQTVQDPTKLCDAARAYESCMRKPFQTLCGPEASWWECERSRVSLGLGENCPTNYCQVTNTVRATNAKRLLRQGAIEKIIHGSDVRNEVLRKMAEKHGQH